MAEVVWYIYIVWYNTWVRYNSPTHVHHVHTLLVQLYQLVPLGAWPCTHLKAVHTMHAAVNTKIHWTIQGPYSTYLSTCRFRMSSLAVTVTSLTCRRSA